MHPSKSIIFFTVSSGTGYGIILCLSYLAFVTDINFDNNFKLLLMITSFVFISSGLLSSTLHLGHPERAWRSFSQWKSSWLSREGLAAVITFFPLMIFYLLWYLDKVLYIYFLHLTSALCLITIYCTGQMYATLKTIPAWNNKLVTPIYTINAICMGALTVYCFTRFYEFEINYLYHLTIVSLSLCLSLKLIYWYVISKKTISTAGSATGLGKNKSISLFEGPHTGKNFLTTEMINKIKKEKANFLRLNFGILTCILPIYMVIQESSLIVDNFILKLTFLFVLIFALIGMLIERYLFFIQAKHVVSLYYGENKI
jgi:sulfite dehydrogenase (quinone) subunit SoeC|tara:strand:+ start:9 stop:950 length:942 start_codon:yes stop_codon:yes gene_type:complete